MSGKTECSQEGIRNGVGDPYEDKVDKKWVAYDALECDQREEEEGDKEMSACDVEEDENVRGAQHHGVTFGWMVVRFQYWERAAVYT